MDTAENKTKAEEIMCYLLLRNVCLPNNSKKTKYVEHRLPTKVLNNGRGEQKSVMLYSGQGVNYLATLSLLLKLNSHTAKMQWNFVLKSSKKVTSITKVCQLSGFHPLKKTIKLSIMRRITEV